jgi:hypothetical protein
VYDEFHSHRKMETEPTSNAKILHVRFHTHPYSYPMGIVDYLVRGGGAKTARLTLTSV